MCRFSNFTLMAMNRFTVKVKNINRSLRKIRKFQTAFASELICTVHNRQNKFVRNNLVN